MRVFSILHIKIFEKSGQQAVESILVFVGVILVMIAVLAKNGFFNRSIDESFDKMITGTETVMKGQVCFSDSVRRPWKVGTWGDCVDGLQHRDLSCPGGCCENPPPLSVRPCP